MRAKSASEEWEEDGNTAHIILVEADRRQIYAAAPRCDTACPAMLDFVVYLLYRTGLSIIAAIPLRLLFAIGQLLGFCARLVSAKYRGLGKPSHTIAIA